MAITLWSPVEGMLEAESASDFALWEGEFNPPARTAEGSSGSGGREEIFGVVADYLANPTKENFEHVETNARTMIFEAITASGHISTIESQWDEDQDGFIAHGDLCRDIFANSLHVAGMPEWEMKRRRAEQSEELWVETLYRQGDFEDRALLTVSAFPEQAPAHEAKQLGYRPVKKTYMLRWNEVDEPGNRKLIQLSMSGSDLEILGELYKRLGYSTDGEVDDVWLLDNPILLEKSDIASVSEIAMILDEMSGADAYGDRGRAKPDYFRLEAISRQRERRAEAEISSFVDRVISIEKSGQPLKQKKQDYEKALKQTVALIVIDQPELGELVGEKSVQQINEARRYMRQGNYDLAMQHIIGAVDVMQALGGCGGTGGNLSIDSMLEVGLGTFDTEDGKESYRFDKLTHCVVCDPDKKARPKMCGPCSICQSCDESIQSGVSASKAGESSRQEDAEYWSIINGLGLEEETVFKFGGLMLGLLDEKKKSGMLS